MPSYTAWQVTLENYVRSPYTFRLSLARRRATLLLLHDIWKLQHPQDMWWLPLLKCCNRQCWQIIVHGNRILWWRHKMKTFSAKLAICTGNSPHKGQWRGALMFSLICDRINCWVNNGEAVDLRRHPAHYDVIVMKVLYAGPAVMIVLPSKQKHIIYLLARFLVWDHPHEYTNPIFSTDVHAK